MQRTWILVGAAILVALILYFFIGRDEPEIATEAPAAIEQMTDDAETVGDEAVGGVEGAATTTGEALEPAANAVEGAAEGAVDGVEGAVEGTPAPANN